MVADKGGKFPDSYKSLLELKGVGDYTAAAIASFAFNEVVPVVDGNVYRVLSRVFGISTPINSTEGQKEFKKRAAQLISHTDPATYNQAIMEFGAIQCMPKNPKCSICPFQEDCVAYHKQMTAELPVKIKKTKVKNLYHHYLVTETPSGNTILEQRPQKGIWAGLYEFPFIESEGALLSNELVGHDKFQELYEKVRFRESGYNQEPIIHKLSHRKIHAYFWIVETEVELDTTISIKEAFQKPVHVLMQRFMTAYWGNFK